jgi:hypothetical protein
MNGIRAFGQNQGGLNHVGDFSLLFSPALPQLADVAAFNPKVQFPFDWAEGDPEQRLVEELAAELTALELRPKDLSQYNALISYYGPGFFPKFAPYIQDDWNEILCFKKPFPDYSDIFQVAFSEEHSRCFHRKDYTSLRELYRSLGFFAYFRNIDACCWECYAADDGLVASLRRHLDHHSIECEALSFDIDYPFGGLKRARNFKGVHPIWPRPAAGT